MGPTPAVGPAASRAEEASSGLDPGKSPGQLESVRPRREEAVMRSPEVTDLSEVKPGTWDPRSLQVEGQLKGETEAGKERAGHGV